MAPLRFNPQSLLRLFQPARASRPKLAKGPRRQKGFGFESLESRQMMAADMAEIVGTVRLDVQNDGNPANDTLVAGATVQLYRDNGLKWEKIVSVKPPQGVDALYALRITQARRCTAYRDGDFMRLLTIAPDHDSTYGRK